MSASIRLLNSISSTWFDGVLSVVWQSTVLILAVALILHFWRRLPPAMRCWAWRLLALKLLIMPFWAIGLPVLTHPPLSSAVPTLATAGIASFADVPASKQLDDVAALDTAEFAPDAASPGDVIEPHVPFTWPSMVVVAFATVVALQLGRFVRQCIQLNELLRATASAPACIADLVSNCSQEIGLREPPDIRIAAAEVSPFVCRVIRPLLVLPVSLAETATAQLRPIVLHELAHIRRRDLVWRLAMEVTRILWWFHPLAHWVAYRESLERELACDQLAMQHAKFSADEYARTLVDAASRMALPSILRAAAAAHFDGGQPLATAATQSSAQHFLRSLES